MSLGFTGENSDWDDKAYRDVIHIGLLYTLWYSLFLFSSREDRWKGYASRWYGKYGTLEGLWVTRE